MMAEQDLRVINGSAAREIMITRAGAPAFPSSRRNRSRLRRSNRSAAVRVRMSRRRAHVIPHDLFVDALERERQRAYRFGESFMLLLVCMKDDRESPRLPESVVEGLGAATRESDMIGWIRPGSAVGIILTAVVSEKGALSSFEARVRQALTDRVDADLASRVAIRCEAYSASTEGKPDVTGGQHSLIRVLCGDQTNRQMHGTVKRGLDIAFSLALLVILSPLLLLIALIVKLSSRGPILFKQVRVGHLARPFTMLKFRTMNVNADHGVHQQYVTEFITRSAQLGPANGGQVFKLVNDSRVTPVGHILRKTSLDELPQLWNVLRGDMSLVGPRPPLPYEVERYQPWHWRRVFDAKPGVTGLWQVTGRSRTTFDGMVRLDLRYAKTCSVWTDLKILLATPKAVVVGKGAC